MVVAVEAAREPQALVGDGHAREQRRLLPYLEAGDLEHDPSFDHIRRLPASGTVPPPRESHSVTVIGSKLYVFGGFDGSRVLNDLYIYDTHAGLWSQLVHTGISPAARAGHSAIALGMPAHILVFGGANSSRRFADVQLFDTQDGHWTKPPVKGRPPAAITRLPWGTTQIL